MAMALNSGFKMPMIGLGVWRMDGNDIRSSSSKPFNLAIVTPDCWSWNNCHCIGRGWCLGHRYRHFLGNDLALYGRAVVLGLSSQHRNQNKEVALRRKFLFRMHNTKLRPTKELST